MGVPAQGFIRTLWNDSTTRLVTGIGLLIIVSGIAINRCLQPLTFEQNAKTIEIVVTALGLLSLVLLVAQNRAKVVWNRYRAYHEFFQNRPPESTIEALEEIAENLKFKDCLKRVAALSDDHVRAIRSVRQTEFSVGAYLDEFEGLCAAINAKIVDEEYAYYLEGTRVVRAYAVFKPLMDEMRKDNKYTLCYLELMKLGAKWKRRKDEEDSARDGNRGVPPHS